MTEKKIWICDRCDEEIDIKVKYGAMSRVSMCISYKVVENEDVCQTLDFHMKCFMKFERLMFNE